MKPIILALLCALLLPACQGDSAATLTSTSETLEEVSRPDFINFEYLESQDATSSGRRQEAFRAKVNIVAVGDQEIVVLATALDANAADQNLAYVLETEAATAISASQLSRAWVVFIQDHLLVFSEDGTDRYRFSINNRPFDTPVINESADFNYSYAGTGLARYTDPQPVRLEDLQGAASYLEARSQTEN